MCFFSSSTLLPPDVDRRVKSLYGQVNVAKSMGDMSECRRLFEEMEILVRPYYPEKASILRDDIRKLRGLGY
jgi:hypothetical protein